MLNSKELPKGFEKHPEDENVQYQTFAQNPGRTNTVNFRQRPGGPGRGLGQTVEKAEDAKKTIARLLVYFSQAKRLLFTLLCSVVFVTLVALLAPALQGEAIDHIAYAEWPQFGVRPVK